MLINKYNSATGLESDTSPTLAVIIRAVLKLDMGGQGGGRHGASINPRWGGTPPLVGVLHGINSKA